MSGIMSPYDHSVTCLCFPLWFFSNSQEYTVLPNSRSVYSEPHFLDILFISRSQVLHLLHTHPFQFEPSEMKGSITPQLLGQFVIVIMSSPYGISTRYVRLS